MSVGIIVHDRVLEDWGVIEKVVSIIVQVSGINIDQGFITVVFSLLFAL